MLIPHHKMLTDHRRMKALRAAVAATVREGDLALDLGAGTGILAMLALRAGARRVIAIEQSPIIHAAARLAADNGFSGKIIFIQADWADVTLDEPADVLITETLGPFGLDENILGAARTARAAMLRPGARTMPRSLELFAAPAECPAIYKNVSDWDNPVAGLNFSELREIAACSIYNEKITERQLVAKPARLAAFDLEAGPLDEMNAEAEFKMPSDCSVHGFAGWFRAELAPGIFIGASPAEPPTHWRQSFFPLRHHFSIKKGDSLALKIISAPAGRGSVFHWFALQRRRGRAVARSNHSSLLAAETKPILFNENSL
jgi:hypothetical protein